MIAKKTADGTEGFSLTHLQSAQIETVRQWRNLPRIRNNLVSKEEITSQQQARWFENLNSNQAHYFMASHTTFSPEQESTQDYGLFSVRNINHQSQTGETGGFIGDENYMSGPASFAASYLLNQILFDKWNFSEVVTSTYQNNPSVVRYNEFLGYQRISQDADGLIWLALTQEAWRKKEGFIRKTVFRF